MLKKLYQKFIDYLKVNKGLDNKQVEVVNYGLKMIMFEIAVEMFMMVAGIVMGVMPYLVVTTLTFGATRLLAGGSHANSRIKCFLTYNIIIWSTIFLSKILGMSVLFDVACWIINIIIFIAYAPGDTIQKPLIGLKRRKKLKRISILIVCFLYVGSIVMRNIDVVISNIIVISNIYTMLLLTPVGYFANKCRLSDKVYS